MVELARDSGCQSWVIQQHAGFDVSLLRRLGKVGTVSSVKRPSTTTALACSTALLWVGIQRAWILKDLWQALPRPHLAADTRSKLAHQHGGGGRVQVLAMNVGKHPHRQARSLVHARCQLSE